MAINYAPLVAEWLSLTGSSTVTTPQQAATVGITLAQIDTLTVTGSIPTLFFVSGLALMECLDFTEFEALTATQQTQLLMICAMPTVQGGSGSFVGKMFANFYSTKLAGPTITALTALAVGAVVPWWQSSGFPAPIAINDLVAAGIITESFAHSQGLV